MAGIIMVIHEKEADLPCPAEEMVWVLLPGSALPTLQGAENVMTLSAPWDFRGDHRAPAWDREARDIPGLAQPLVSWCIRILALIDTLCLVSAAHLQRREWVMNLT